jgi:hypothetical protein
MSIGQSKSAQRIVVSLFLAFQLTGLYCTKSYAQTNAGPGIEAGLNKYISAANAYLKLYKEMKQNFDGGKGQVLLGTNTKRPMKDSTGANHG